MKNIKKLFKIQIVLKIMPLIGIFIISGFLFYYLKQDKDPSIPASALLNKKIPEIESGDLLENNIDINNGIFFVGFWITFRCHYHIYAITIIPFRRFKLI